MIAKEENRKKNLLKKRLFQHPNKHDTRHFGNLSIRFLNQGSRQKKSDGTMEGFGRPAIEKKSKSQILSVFYETSYVGSLLSDPSPIIGYACH